MKESLPAQVCLPMLTSRDGRSCSDVSDVAVTPVRSTGSPVTVNRTGWWAGSTGKALYPQISQIFTEERRNTTSRLWMIIWKGTDFGEGDDSAGRGCAFIRVFLSRLGEGALGAAFPASAAGFDNRPDGVKDVLAQIERRRCHAKKNDCLLPHVSCLIYRWVYS